MTTAHLILLSDVVLRQQCLLSMTTVDLTLLSDMVLRQGLYALLTIVNDHSRPGPVDRCGSQKTKSLCPFDYRQ